MRSLFMVLAKLLGLLKVFSFLTQSTYLVSMALQDRSEGGSGLNVEMMPILAGMALLWLVELGLAWVLLTRTEWLADRLNIRDAHGLDAFDAGSMLAVGLKLIGVYAIVSAVPDVAQALLQTPLMPRATYAFASWFPIVPPILKLAIGFILVLNTDRVLDRIWYEDDLEISEDGLPGTP